MSWSTSQFSEEFELYELLKKCGAVIDSKNLGSKFAYHMNKTKKITGVHSKRCLSFVGAQQKNTYNGLTDREFLEVFDKNDEIDLTLNDLYSCINELNKYLINPDSPFNFIAPNIIHNKTNLESVYSWAKDIKSKSVEKNIQQIEFNKLVGENKRVNEIISEFKKDEITIESEWRARKYKDKNLKEEKPKVEPPEITHEDFNGDIAKMELFGDMYYVIRLDDVMWSKKVNGQNAKRIPSIFRAGNVGMYPYITKSGVLNQPTYITILQSEFENYLEKQNA